MKRLRRCICEKAPASRSVPSAVTASDISSLYASSIGKEVFVFVFPVLELSIFSVVFRDCSFSTSIPLKNWNSFGTVADYTQHAQNQND